MCIELNFVMLCVPLLKVCSLISTANTNRTILNNSGEWHLFHHQTMYKLALWIKTDGCCTLLLF